MEVDAQPGKDGIWDSMGEGPCTGTHAAVIPSLSPQSRHSISLCVTSLHSELLEPKVSEATEIMVTGPSQQQFAFLASLPVSSALGWGACYGANTPQSSNGNLFSRDVPLVSQWLHVVEPLWGLFPFCPNHCRIFCKSLRISFLFSWSSDSYSGWLFCALATTLIWSCEVWLPSIPQPLCSPWLLAF